MLLPVLRRRLGCKRSGACVLSDLGGAGCFGGELGSELQSVHQDVGLAIVNAGFAEGIEDLSDGELDASGLFDGGKLQVVVGVLGSVQGLVELLVAVAICHTPERGAVAVSSSRHDVPTSFDHVSLHVGIPPPHLFRLNMLFAINCKPWWG
jgi:hypothetical protein